MRDECSLCGLPTPEQPITAADTEGSFCCRGCLEVTRALDDDGIDTAAVEERARAGAGTDDGQPTPEPDLDESNEEAFLDVAGMHCTTCEAFVALRGESRDGIDAVSASYATETVRVRYDPDRIDESELPEALSGYGYSARFREEAVDRRPGRDEETLQRLLVGGALAMLIMPWYFFFLYPSYVGIETGILTFDRTTAFGLYFPMLVVGALTAVVVGYTGWPILRGAYVSLRARRPNMDLLLSVAILSAVAYSTLALARGSTHLYYDVAVAIVLVVTAGGYYEGKLKRQATRRLSELTSAQVSEATRRREDGTTETVSVEALRSGDEVVVSPGERVPVDGTVVEGIAAVDEALLTGESMPATKRPGDQVVGGSVVTDSALVIEVGDDAASTLDRITSMLWAVQSDRPGVQRFADRLATVFVPMVLVVGLGVTLWRFVGGDPASAALLAGLTVLVAACPCAMGLATPLAVAGGLRDALWRGIVVTNSGLFEDALSVETVVFDKTGTLTTGEMTVREVVGDPEAVEAAAAVERYSSHPIASAIVERAATPVESDAASPDGGAIPGGADGERDSSDATSTAPEVSDFERHPGRGVSGTVDGERVVVGTRDLVREHCGPLSGRLDDAVARAHAAGDVPVVVGVGDRSAAVAVVGDREREDWQRTLEAFDDREVILLTGDDESATARFREHPAVDRVFAGVPPDGKAATVRELNAVRSTAMVGDGTNDAPALAAADLGVAIAGAARAADAADVVIVDGTLGDVPAVFDLASATRRRIRENVGWALVYNGIALPLAVFGVLNPLAAAIAMATSSILVVTNSRRRLL